MIPQGGALSNEVGLGRKIRPSRTYALDFETGRMIGMVDGLEAIRQAAMKILLTERFEHAVYGSSYGSELRSLLGREAPYVHAELSRRIREALLQDDRIRAVEDLLVRVSGDEAIATFTLVTDEGNITMSKEVGRHV